MNPIGPDTHPLRLSVLIVPTLQTITLRLRVTKLAGGGAKFKPMEAPESLLGTPNSQLTGPQGGERGPLNGTLSLSFLIYALREGITTSQASELNESILHTVQ